MTRELNRLSFVLILGFGLIAVSTFFWSVIQRDSLLAREDNPRRVLAEFNFQRGSIFDRNNQILAYSEPADNPALGAERIYPHPEVVSAVGHYSYQYGQAALEEGFDAWLRAVGMVDTETRLTDDLLNRPTVGGDVRSTLDLNLQLALHRAMEGYSGAGLVVHVPSAEVLAMVSLPDYDPNNDTLLRRLVGERAEDEPTPEPEEINTRLLNRVTTGQYQPGGTLQTLLLNTLLASNVSAETTVPVHEMVLESPPLTLNCTFEPQATTLTLAEAYRLGCPNPFVEAVGSTISEDAFENILAAAGFFEPTVLGGFILPGDSLAQPALDNLAANAAGQGSLTVTPLHMAQIIAAILNRGNGVPLHLASATRYPANAEWQAIEISPSPIAIMQPHIALAIENILRQESYSDEFPIYGHISRAYAGDREYIWFLGWTPLEDGSNITLTLVLESKTLTPQIAIDMAVKVLSEVQNPS